MSTTGENFVLEVPRGALWAIVHAMSDYSLGLGQSGLPILKTEADEIVTAARTALVQSSAGYRNRIVLESSTRLTPRELAKLERVIANTPGSRGQILLNEDGSPR